MDFAIDKGLEIGVYLDDPVPEKLAASAGLNSYPIGIFWKVLPDGWEAQQFFLASFQPYKDWLYIEENTVVWKLQHVWRRGRGEFIIPKPIATGKQLVMAPKDPEHNIRIQSDGGLMLFDGRNLGQNGWFIVRSLLPASKTAKY